MHARLIDFCVCSKTSLSIQYYFKICLNYTVNCEYFVVKIFLDSLAYAKIKRAKIYVQYNAVQDRLSENYLT